MTDGAGSWSRQLDNVGGTPLERDKRRGRVVTGPQTAKGGEAPRPGATSGTKGRAQEAGPLVFVGRQAPVRGSGNPVFRYRVSEADEFVPLDQLIVSHGIERVRHAVDVWDTENRVEFSVASVMEVDRDGSVALLSFVGYPVEFDDWTPLSFGTHERYRHYGEELEKFLRSTGDSLSGLYGVIDDDDEAKVDAPKKQKAGPRGGKQSASAKAKRPAAPVSGGLVEVSTSAQVDVDLLEEASIAHGIAVVNGMSEHDDGSDGDFAVSKSSSREKARNGGAKSRSSAKSAPLDDANVAEAVAGIAKASKARTEKFLALSKERKKAKKAKAVVEKTSSGFKQIGTQVWAAGMFFTSISTTVYKCRLCEAEVQLYTKKKDNGEIVVKGSNLVAHLAGKAHSRTWERAKEKLGNKDMEVVTSYIETLCAAHEKDGREQGKTQATMDTVLRRQRGDGSRIDVNFAYMAHLVESQISFNSVESDSFKNFACVSGMYLDSSSQMKGHLDLFYDIIKGKACARLQSCPGISLTFDMWTSMAATKYLVITYHGITFPGHERVTHLLDLLPVEGPSFGVLIADLVDARLGAHLGEQCQIVSVTTDNGSNVKKARKILAADGVPCFNHCLKGVIDIVFGEGGPEELQTQFQHEKAVKDYAAIKAVCNACRLTSWVKMEIEKEDYLCFILENVTRWSGKYLSLARFLELEQALVASQPLKDWFAAKFEDKANMPVDLLKPSFFRRLQSYKDVLIKIQEVTVECQAESASVALIPHLIQKLQDACSDESDNFALCLSGAIEERLVKVFLTGASFTLQSSLLDPRYSLEATNKIGQQRADGVWDAIAAKAASIDPEAQRDADSHHFKYATIRASVPLLLRDMAAWREDNEKATDDDVLKYWRSRDPGHTSASFAKVAALYHSAMASSAASERGFSSTTGVITKKRTSMSDSLLEKLTVVRDYMRYPEYKFSNIMEDLKAKLAVRSAEKESSKTPRAKVQAKLVGAAIAKASPPTRSAQKRSRDGEEEYEEEDADVGDSKGKEDDE